MGINCNYNKPSSIPHKIYFNNIHRTIPNYNNSFLLFNQLIFKNNLDISNNLFINSITFNSLNINNNASFISNINTHNIRNKFNGFLLLNKNFNNINNIISIKNNICSHNFKLSLIKNDIISDFYINNNINIFNNLNIDKIKFYNNLNFNKNIINKFTTTFNLSVSNNTSINNFFINHNNIHFKSNLSFNTLIIQNNFSNYGNLNTNFFVIKKNLYINNNLSIQNGILNLSPTSNSTIDGTLYLKKYPNDKDFIIGKIYNQEVIINEFHTFNTKNNINLFNNHHIKFTYNSINKLHFTKSFLNITPQTFIYGNSYILHNITITNNSHFNNKLIIHNNSSTNKFLFIPSNTFITNKKYHGAITYNTNIKEINIFNNNNQWDYLQFIDKNYTGIFRKNHQFDFKIFNNTIFTYNKNGFLYNNTIYKNNTFLINNNITIFDTFYTNHFIYINNIPIQFYNNLFRSFNYTNHKWTSLTLEYLNCFYKIPYQSYKFIIYNTTNHYKLSNTFHYIHPSNLLFNNYYLFDLEIINYDLYISHLYFHSISNPLLYNTFYISIYKNFSIFHNITIHTNSNTLYKFNIPIIYHKNDILQIYVKSKYITNNFIKIQLFGYNISPYLNLVGDSNFLTDTPIFFNNNTISNVKFLFNNNINIHNSLLIHNNSNNTNFTINKLSFSKNIYHNTLFEIDNKLFITNNSIGFGKHPTHAFIDIINHNNYFKYAFINKGSILCQSNLNIFNNLFTNNININNYINTNNIFTDLFLSNNIYNINTIQANNIFIHTNINFSQNSLLNANNLILSKYNSNLTIYPNSCYLSKTYYNNILFKYTSSHINIYPKKLHISNNSNSLNFNNFIKIKNNDVSIATHYNTNNIVTISNVFHIQKNNYNTYIKNDLILNHINISQKIKSLLYDLYAPKNIYVYYDFYNNSYNSNIILYNNSTPIIIPFNHSYIKINNKNNILYHTILNKPYHIFYNFKSYIEILYFIDIILIDNTIRNFYNNIKSYTLYNPYNYNINIKFNLNGTQIYPSYTFTISNNTYTIYGLKTYII